MGVLLRTGACFCASEFPGGISFRQLTLVIESQAAINKQIPNEVAPLAPW